MGEKASECCSVHEMGLTRGAETQSMRKMVEANFPQ